jgi:hypothetical protein
MHRTILKAIITWIRAKLIRDETRLPRRRAWSVADEGKIAFRTDEQRMALGCFGYGRWDAPYWFIGPEQGKGRKEAGANALRINAWLRLGATELSDCREFHSLIGESDWHKETPVLQRTWRPLIVLLMTFLGKSVAQESIRAYQRDCWGREKKSDGETCVIELAGLAAKSLKVPMARSQFSKERTALIRQRMLTHKPTFVVMYGLGAKKHWNVIAEGCTLVRDNVATLGSTMIALAPHPNEFGREDAAWIELGRKLRAKADNSGN